MGKLSHIPGPRGLEFIKGVQETRRDVLAIFKKFSEEGDIFSVPWPMNFVFLFHPEAVKKVLLDNSKNYKKGDSNKELMAILGEGLATVFDHDKWLRKYTIISKEFNPKAVSNFAGIFKDITQEYLDEMKFKESVDICDEMKKLTFFIACRTLLAAKMSDKDADTVNEAVLYTTKVAYQRIFQFLPVPYWVPTPTNFEFKRHMKAMDEIVYRLIDEEKSRPKSPDPKTILERLVHAVDPSTGQGLSHQELRDEVLTTMIAGHETSAHALTWTMGLLARDQKIQDKLREEINANVDLQPTEYLEKMPYLKAVILEAMRIYPSFPIIAKVATNDDELLGHKIPKGTNIIIPLIYIQRSPKNWDRPMEFIPERFIGTDAARSTAYLPFSRGPRKCIGELFAMTEMAVVVFKMIQNFKLELEGTTLPKEVAYFTLKPESKLMVRVHRLSAEA